MEENASKLTVAGWGRTESARSSDLLRWTELQLVENGQCQQEYDAARDKLGRLSILESQMCARDVEGSDSCGGDSGGPLMVPVGQLYMMYFYM